VELGTRLSIGQPASALGGRVEGDKEGLEAEESTALLGSGNEVGEVPLPKAFRSTAANCVYVLGVHHTRKMGTSFGVLS
jgi:hypothetical protein